MLTPSSVSQAAVHDPYKQPEDYGDALSMCHSPQPPDLLTPPQILQSPPSQVYGGSVGSPPSMSLMGGNITPSSPSQVLQSSPSHTGYASDPYFDTTNSSVGNLTPHCITTSPPQSGPGQHHYIRQPNTISLGMPSVGYQQHQHQHQPEGITSPVSTPITQQLIASPISNTLSPFAASPSPSTSNLTPMVTPPAQMQLIGGSPMPSPGCPSLLPTVNSLAPPIGVHRGTPTQQQQLPSIHQSGQQLSAYVTGYPQSQYLPQQHQQQTVANSSQQQQQQQQQPQAPQPLPTAVPPTPTPEPSPTKQKKVKNFPTCGGRKTFVGQLPKDITRQELNDIMSVYGKISDMKMLLDKKTGQGTGAAFVVFAEAASAVKAVAGLNNKMQLPGMATRMQMRLAEGEYDSSKDVKLFVGQIPTTTTQTELDAIFSHPDCLEVALLKKDNKSRGCAFVRYSSRDAAEDAVARLNGKLILDGAQTPITVRMAYTEADKRRRGRTAGHTAQSGTSSPSCSSPSSAGSPRAQNS